MRRPSLTLLGDLAGWALFIIVTLVICLAVSNVMQNGRDRGPRINCSSNLRQIELGIMMYVEDNDETLPPVDNLAQHATWKNTVMPYIKIAKTFQCPDRKDPMLGNDGLPISYAVNTAGVGRKTRNRGPFAPSLKPTVLSDIDYPAQLIAICEVRETNSPGFDIDDSFFGPRRQVLYAGHNKQTYYAFMDGHVMLLHPGGTLKSINKDNPKTLDLWYLDGTKPLSSNGQQILAATDKVFADSKD